MASQIVLRKSRVILTQWVTIISDQEDQNHQGDKAIMTHDINPNTLNFALRDLRERVTEQCERMTDPLFTFDRNGLRLAIAAIEDETKELYDEWRMHKRHLGNAHAEIQHELLDIAAVAIIAYTQTMESK